MEVKVQDNNFNEQIAINDKLNKIKSGQHMNKDLVFTQ